MGGYSIIGPREVDVRGDTMDIIVHDTLSLLRPLFTLRARPRALLARAQEPLFGPQGIRGWVGVPMAEKDRGGYAVMQAARQDGYDVMMAQQMWGLFDPGRKPEASEWAFDRLACADALAIVRSWLHACADVLPAPAGLSRVACALLPADPANWNLMAMNHGLSAFGGVPGYLLAEVWPSAGNMARLRPAIARVFAHNVRWAYAPPAGEATLGDIVVLEGLAAAFVAAVCPDAWVEPWLVAFRAADDWPEDLAAVARLYDVAAFDEIGFNVYGARYAAGLPWSPPARPLAVDELAYARDVIGAALETTIPSRIAAYLYGDEVVGAHGHPTVGLPPYAGFEVGYHLMQDYLWRTGRSVAQAMVTPSAEILAEAQAIV